MINFAFRYLLEIFKKVEKNYFAHSYGTKIWEVLLCWLGMFRFLRSVQYFFLIERLSFLSIVRFHSKVCCFCFLVLFIYKYGCTFESLLELFKLICSWLSKSFRYFICEFFICSWKPRFSTKLNIFVGNKIWKTFQNF